MRAEGDEQPWDIEFGGTLGDAAQDVAVAEVNAVERPDGDDGAARELRQP
jgi:hypothetical protein